MIIVGMSGPLLGQSCQAHSYSVEGDLKPELASLEFRLGPIDTQGRHLVLTSPAVLGYCVEGNLEHKLAFLNSRLDLNDGQVRTLVLTTP